MLVKDPSCNLKEKPSIKFNTLNCSVCCWIIWLSWQFCLKRYLPLNCKYQYSSISSCAAVIHHPLRIKRLLNCKITNMVCGFPCLSCPKHKLLISHWTKNYINFTCTKYLNQEQFISNIFSIMSKIFWVNSSDK